jgi:hypothetical protein
MNDVEPFTLPPGVDSKMAIEVVIDQFGRNMRDMKSKLHELETKLAEIETKGILFCGAYQKSTDYKRGSLVVSGGSLWAAVTAIEAGDAPPGPKWQLAAKAGRDARDLRVA